MIFSYENCIEIYGTDYMLKKAISNNEIFKYEPGIYSDKNKISDLEYISFVRPDAIITMKTAFYIYGFTDEIPDKYDLAINRLSSRATYKRCKVKYYFLPKEILNIGKIKYNYNGIDINIYDKERMLIELLRYNKKIPFDLYKEVIDNYRKKDIDFEKLENYIKMFKIKDKIIEKVRLEIM